MLIRSIGARLTAAFTAAAAAMLALFALGTWYFVMQTAAARADQTLADYTRAFVDAWATEYAERAGTPHAAPNAAAAAAGDAVPQFRYTERRVLVFDGAGRLVAATDTAPVAPALTLRRIADPAGRLGALRAAARPAHVATATLDGGADDEVPVRAAATRVAVGGVPFTVLTLRSLRADDEATETFTEALAVAVPLALVLAAAGGYWLVRASLAPTVEMARAAARLGGDHTRHERLPVRTPHDELGELATVFNGLLGRVEEGLARQVRATEQQRQFMADASHELRTPVTALASVADVALARADRDPAELRDALDVVRTESRRLGRIVDDLFLLARADAGQLPVRMAPIYLEEVLETSARAARALAAARGVALDAPPADEAPFTGDAHLLGRLVLNLLDNAVKYTPAGGHVWLRLTRQPATPAGPAAYTIAVEDTGCGVGEDARARLFERFFRGDAARTRAKQAPGDEDAPADGRAGGAGLGLAIAQWIAEAHGGTVTLAATGPHGSRFEVRLPVDHAASATGATIAG